MGIEEDKEPTRSRGNSHNAFKLGHRSIRLLSAVVVLVLLLFVVLVLYDHVTPFDGPHITP